MQGALIAMVVTAAVSPATSAATPPVAPPVASATKADAARAIAAAAAAMKTAAGYHDQWLETGIDFKEAKAAAAKGDYALARRKAGRAETLARLSIGQARSQAKLWQDEVPK